MTLRALAAAVALGAALLGATAGRATGPELTVLLDRGLDRPTALAFNPRDGVLWIVNYTGDASVVVTGLGTTGQAVRSYWDYSEHYLNNPTGIAFSPTRNEFATVGDNRNDYNGRFQANNFMGPTLWTADLAHFDGGTRSHLDMVHHSPLAMGIAAGRDPVRREYWVFNGAVGCIDRYFFFEPHELGGSNHRDGMTYRYAPGQLRRVAGVPGHLAYDAASRLLYVADTGRGRIAVLDTRASLARSRRIRGNGETPLVAMPRARLRTLAGGFRRPSGLLLARGRLVVGDHSTGVLTVLRLDGTVETRFDTGLGPDALTGIALGPEGKLYLLDARRNRLLRLDSPSLLP
jgi:hypothetical protein